VVLVTISDFFFLFKRLFLTLNSPSFVHSSLQVRIYRGHMNEKNFVGLTANSEYLSCGSETNEVFVYHKVIQVYPELLLHYFLIHSSVLKVDDISSHVLSIIIQVWLTLSHRPSLNLLLGIDSAHQNSMKLMRTGGPLSVQFVGRVIAR